MNDEINGLIRFHLFIKADFFLGAGLPFLSIGMGGFILWYRVVIFPHNFSED